MENKAHALAAGVFVAALLALLLALAAWLTRDTAPRDTYEISTREAVTGLQEQAPVRFRGVDVGKVQAIGFDAKAQGNVLVRLAIDRDVLMTRETFATLSFQGVTGLAFIQLDDSGAAAPRLQANDAAPPRIPLKPGLLSKLTERGEAILEQTEQITAKLNTLLEQPNQQRLASALDNMGQAATNVSQAANQLSRLSTQISATLDAQLGPQKVSIPAFVKSADAAVASLRGTSEEARATLAELGLTVRKINAPGGPVDQLTEGTAALSQAAQSLSGSTLPQVSRVAEDTGRAVRQLSRTVGGINENPQSLIFGGGAIEPGPGEPGFAAPSAAGGRK